jgi:hypothetical protein
VTKLAPVFVNDDLMTVYRAWLHSRAIALSGQIEPVRLDQIPSPWCDEFSGGLIARGDNLFFAILGVFIPKMGGREVPNWGQPGLVEASGLGRRLIEMMRHPGEAAYDLFQLVKSGAVNPDDEAEFDGKVVLLRDRSDHYRCLVRVIAEPGNWGVLHEGVNTHVLVGPSFSASQGNMANHEKARRGETDPRGNPYREIPLYEFLKRLEREGRVEWCVSPGSGGRQMFLRNRLAVVEIAGNEKMDVNRELVRVGQAEDFAWVSIKIMRKIRTRDANHHLLAALGLMA